MGASFKDVPPNLNTRQFLSIFRLPWEQTKPAHSRNKSIDHFGGFFAFSAFAGDVAGAFFAGLSFFSKGLDSLGFEISSNVGAGGFSRAGGAGACEAPVGKAQSIKTGGENMSKAPKPKTPNPTRPAPRAASLSPGETSGLD